MTAANPDIGSLRDDGIHGRRFCGKVFLVRDSTVLPPEGPRVPDLGTRHPRTFPAWRSGREEKWFSLGSRTSNTEIRNEEEKGNEPACSPPFTFVIYLTPSRETARPPSGNRAATSCEQTRKTVRRDPVAGPLKPPRSGCGPGASGKRHAGACRPCAGKC